MDQQDLDNLQERICQAQASGSSSPQEAAGLNAGIHAGLELVGSIIGGGLIGYGLDQWFDSKPIFLIVFLLLGIAAGFYNVYRVTKNLGTAVGISQLHREGKDAKQAPELEESTQTRE